MLGADTRKACDLNMEKGEHLLYEGKDKYVHRKQAPDSTPADLRRAGFEWQVTEAARLAAESRLLEPGTRASEITSTDISKVESVAAAWTALSKKLKERLQ